MITDMPLLEMGSNILDLLIGLVR